MHRNFVFKVAASLGVGVLATTAAWPSPAFAKGIESATIDGPGLDGPIDVRASTGPELAELTSLWAVIPDNPQPVTMADQAPTVELGPSYIVIWGLLTDVDETTALHQWLYPHAEGGPVVYTATGQQIFDSITTGGWSRAPDALRELLLRLGVPPLDSLATADGSGDCASTDFSTGTASMAVPTVDTTYELVGSTLGAE